MWRHVRKDARCIWPLASSVLQCFRVSFYRGVQFNNHVGNALIESEVSKCSNATLPGNLVSALKIGSDYDRLKFKLRYFVNNVFPSSVRFGVQMYSLLS